MRFLKFKLKQRSRENDLEEGSQDQTRAKKQEE